MLSMAQIQRQYLKVTLQSVDNTGIGSCIFRKVEAPKLHFWGTFLVFLFLLIFFYFYLLIPNRFQSLVFSSNSLEALELLMPARKNILLRSEEYLCSVSNTNRRRFKYCSSGVCLCKRVRQRERLWVYCVHLCVEARLVVHTKGWEIVWACMCVCVWDTMCVPRGYFCSLCGVQLKWTIDSATLHPLQRDTTEH